VPVGAARKGGGVGRRTQRGDFGPLGKRRRHLYGLAKGGGRLRRSARKKREQFDSVEPEKDKRDGEEGGGRAKTWLYTSSFLCMTDVIFRTREEGCQLEGAKECSPMCCCWEKGQLTRELRSRYGWTGGNLSTRGGKSTRAGPTAIEVALRGNAPPHLTSHKNARHQEVERKGELRLSRKKGSPETRRSKGIKKLASKREKNRSRADR